MRSTSSTNQEGAVTLSGDAVISAGLNGIDAHVIKVTDGSPTITSRGSVHNGVYIKSDGTLVVESGATLNVTGSNGINSDGRGNGTICVYGTLNVNSDLFGIINPDVTVSGGTLNATSGEPAISNDSLIWIAILSYEIIVDDGVLTAIGGNYGIFLDNWNGPSVSGNSHIVASSNLKNLIIHP